MEKLKWKYKKRKRKWIVHQLIHPSIEIKKYVYGWKLFFKGTVEVEIPFVKISSAKKCAQLIHNG